MRQQKPIRILQILPSLNKGAGIAAAVLTWHKHIDTDKVQFDYLYFEDRRPVNYKEEISALGGNYYLLPYPSLKNSFKFIKALCKFFKEHKYKTIHSHLSGLNIFFYPTAKLYGVKNIIQHAHGVKWSDKPLNGVRNCLMLFSVRGFITHKLACSEAAGNFWYGRGYKVIANAVELKDFAFNLQQRVLTRKELGIENKFVCGHVGRFEGEKNHSFLIDIFYHIKQKHDNAQLLLAGKGTLEDTIRKQAADRGLQDDVKFLGVRNDCPCLYQAMDCLIFPSKHEGFGLVVLEAYAAGLPCFISDALCDFDDMQGIYKIPLSLSARQWAEIILEKMGGLQRVEDAPKFAAARFDCKGICKDLEDFYLEITEGF